MQVSKAVGRWQAGLEPWPREGLAAIKGEEILLDAALGILAYKVNPISSGLHFLPYFPKNCSPAS